MFYQEQARLFLLGVVIALAEAFVVYQVLGRALWNCNSHLKLFTKSVGVDSCVICAVLAHAVHRCYFS